MTVVEASVLNASEYTVPLMVISMDVGVPVTVRVCTIFIFVPALATDTSMFWEEGILPKRNASMKFAKKPV